MVVQLELKNKLNIIIKDFDKFNIFKNYCIRNIDNIDRQELLIIKIDNKYVLQISIVPKNYLHNKRIDYFFDIDNTFNLYNNNYCKNPFLTLSNEDLFTLIDSISSESKMLVSDCLIYSIQQLKKGERIEL